MKDEVGKVLAGNSDIGVLVPFTILNYVLLEKKFS